ncbi:acyltransferase family protein, partial [Parabacteroides goldsteinii]
MISPLTSLRFLFALMVFGAHIYTIDPYFDHLFYKEGFVGVNFFFILSGFIIAYTYRDRLLEQKSTLREFWVARIARIYPLHLLTLGISVYVGGYISGDLIDWIKHFVANLFLLQPFIP